MRTLDTAIAVAISRGLYEGRTIMGEAKRRANYRADRYAVGQNNLRAGYPADGTVAEDHKAAKRRDAAKRAAATRKRNKENNV